MTITLIEVNIILIMSWLLLKTVNKVITIFGIVIALIDTVNKGVAIFEN